MQDSLLLDLQTTKLIPMPEWGYFGSFIKTSRRGFDDYDRTPNHELNARWGGLCKDLVYGGNYVVMPTFYFNSIQYKVGDIVTTWIGTEENPYLAMIKWSSYFNGWALFALAKYEKDLENADIPLSLCNITKEQLSKVKVVTNLLIEYSKRLRGEENRLEELEGLIKI